MTRSTLAALVAALLLAACSGGTRGATAPVEQGASTADAAAADDASEPATDAAAPTDTAAPTGPTGATGATGADASGAADADQDATAGAGATPERIVSLSPTATEILFAIGAGDAVVAVDDQSDFPEGVPTTDLSGFEPNVEAIAGYDPDLVVVAFAAEDVRTGLEGLDVEVLEQPAATTLDDTYAQIEELGARTGTEDDAAALVENLRARIEELTARVPERETAPTYYHELDDQLFTATSSTFIGAVYALAGLENVADAADPDGAAGGYPQLSAEYLLESDPDYVFLADTECCGQTAATFAARPGFGDLTAVAEGRVVELSDDVASRWGPRTVDLLETIIDATAS